MRREITLIINGHSTDIKLEKLKQLQQILPEIFTEDKIDFDKLKTFYGDKIELNNERYHLNWAGKSNAFRELQTSSCKTLVPLKAESIDFDNTKNIFIEGENLEALKVLQKSYFGKVKMIYIDPPYNTGNDFIYNDKFKQKKQDYQTQISENQDDDISDAMIQNSKDKGHYHSNWLNMMMPRLHLAKSLLRDDGVIFISIDDNEVHNLRLLCNEIFGEENFVGEFVVTIAPAGTQSSDQIAQQHAYCLCFQKSNIFNVIRYQLSNQEKNKKYKDKDHLGCFYIERLWKRGIGGKKEDTPSLHFAIYYDALKNKIYIDDEVENNKNNKLIKIIPYQTKGVLGRWVWSKEKMKQDRHLLLVKETAGSYKLYRKKYIDDEIGKLPYSIIPANIGRTEIGSIELKKLMQSKVFDYPKASCLIKYFIKISTTNNDIILDFFAGSGTTAHAVMELNKEDGGNRQYICVQLPEICKPASEAYTAGYKTIADICKDRIRRVSQKIAQEITASELDLGFKVFKIQDSNFKQWRDDIQSETELLEQIEMFIDPVLVNAQTENIIYELLLKNGLDLNSKIVKHNGYYAVHSSNNDQEMVILMLEITNQLEHIIQDIIKSKPVKVIALDRIFNNNDQLKKNTALQMCDANINFKTI